MSLSFSSTRFGDVTVADSALVVFPDGLVGLPGNRYAVLASDPTLVATGDPGPGPFWWLHSTEDPAVALPVTHPERFFPDYAVEVDEDDLPPALRAAAPTSDDPTVWVAVRAADRLEDFVVNLRAPLLVRAGEGWQVINRAQDAALRAPLPLPTTDGGSRTQDAAA